MLGWVMLAIVTNVHQRTFLSTATAISYTSGIAYNRSMYNMLVSDGIACVPPPLCSTPRLEPTMNRVKMLHNAYDFIVTFLEGMVESTLDVQKENQRLLRCVKNQQRSQIRVI